MATRFPKTSNFRLFFAAALTFGLLPAVCPPAPAQDSDESAVPGAPHLLPEGTYLYARLDNADDLREGLKDSSIGKMLNDPKLKPFASDLYATLRDLFDQISDQVGVSLDELLSIPSGQVAVAMIPGKFPEDDDDRGQAAAEVEDDSPDAIRRRLARQRRRENGFAGVIIVDAGDNVDKLMAIIDRLDQRATLDGYVQRNLKVSKTEIVRLLPPRQGPPEIEYFERDGVVVFGIGHRTGQDVLERWLDENEEPTLADSANFSSVMSRCVGAESTRPQLTFYADPYHVAERLVMRSGNMAVGLFWPMIEDLGVARLRGLGGSSFRGGEIFEDIFHFHILIDPPRDGLLAVLRPETGDSTPPDFVPSDVTAYTSLYWDLPNTYENVGKIIDKFQGDDSLKRLAEEPLKKRLGIDLREDVVGNFTGRYVRAIWMEPPVRLNSQSSLNAFELKDPVAVKSVIAKFRERVPNATKVETIAGKVVYFSQQAGRGNFPENLRRPEYCMVIAGNWMIIADSRKFLERALRAQSGTISRLISVPEYDLVASELGGKLDGEKPFLVSYVEGSDMLRQMYDLAQADGSRQFLRRAGENNVVARQMADLVGRHELPPFADFEKYFAPSGSFAYDEPTGIHFGSFTLRATRNEQTGVPCRTSASHPSASPNGLLPRSAWRQCCQLPPSKRCSASACDSRPSTDANATRRSADS